MANTADTYSQASAFIGSAGERFRRLPRMAIVATGLLLVVAIAFLDYVTGPQVMLNIFYLVPVMLVAWACDSTGYGLIILAATCLVGPVEARMTGYQDTSLTISIWNATVRLEVFFIVLQLMSTTRGLIRKLQEQAMVDELTGAANLRALRDIATKEIDRSRRFHHPLTLAYIDIDGFKAVNDRAGHVAGDRTLISLASTAHATTRSIDTVARIGGDEFVVLMPETGGEAALPLADRIREAFARTTTVIDIPITCSVGVASFHRPPQSVDELLMTADELMYEAKASGGNNVRARVLEAPPRVIPFPVKSKSRND